MDATLPDAPHTTTDVRWAPIPEALLYDRDVDPLAVRLYGALMRHGLDPASCYPSHRRLAELVGVAQRSVARPLATLEAAGWITRTPRHKANGERDTDGYHVHTTPRAGERAHPAGQRGPSPLSSVDPPRASARTRKRATEREQLNERTPAPATADAGALVPEVVDPVHDASHRLAVAAFEQDPRPVTPFVAVMARCREALEAGWTEQQVAYVIRVGDVAAWTREALQLALNRRRQSADARRGGSPLAALVALAAEEHAP